MSNECTTYVPLEQIREYISYKANVECLSRSNCWTTGHLLKRMRHYPVGDWSQRLLQLRPKNGGEYYGETRKAYWYMCKRFLEWCAQKGYSYRNTFEKCPKFPKTNRLPRPWTKEQIEEILYKADNIAIWRGKVNPKGSLGDMVRFQLSTGLRTGEMIALRPEHINLEENKVIIIPSISKTKQYREIPIGEELRDLCIRWSRIRPNQPTFWAIRQGTFYRKWRMLKVKYAPYSARHTFITDLVRANYTTAKCMRLSGHKGYNSFKCYEGTKTEDLRDSVTIKHY